MKWRDNIYQIFDFLRFPLVLFIVFLHCKGEPSDLRINWHYFGIIDAYNFLRNYISNVLCIVAVPTFFIMSGYLFYVNIEKLSFVLYIGKIRRRLKTLIVPYVFWITIYLAGNLFFIIRSLESASIWESVFAYLKENGFLHIYYDCNLTDVSDTNTIGFLQDNSSPLLIPMWFVRDLFMVSLFSPLIWWGIRKVGFIFVIILGVCYLFSFWPYVHGFSIQSFFYFSIGLLMSENANKLDMFFCEYGWQLALFYFLSSFFMVYFIDTKNICLPYFGKCFTIIGCLTMLFLAYKLYSSKQARIFHYLARTSFVVYAAHMVFVSKYVRIYTHHLIEIWGGNCVFLLLEYFTVPFLTSGICVLFYFIVNRLCPKLLVILNGGR